MILQHRQAEELLSRMVEWTRGYESEHREISRLAVALHDASIPVQGNGEHWSIANEFPRGAGAKFRIALNALFKYLKD
jgi:hypothetical protein